MEFLANVSDWIGYVVAFLGGAGIAVAVALPKISAALTKAEEFLPEGNPIDDVLDKVLPFIQKAEGLITPENVEELKERLIDVQEKVDDLAPDAE